MHMNAMVEYKACPWCGSNDRKPVADVSVRGNDYLVALEKVAQIAPGTMAKGEAFQCVECQTIYQGSFFNEHVSAAAFLTETSGHNHGWRSFHAKTGLLPKKDLEGLRDEPRLKNAIIKAVSPINEVYAEVGCPFSGLFHTLAFPEESNTLVRSKYLQFLLDTIKYNKSAFSSFYGFNGTMIGLFGLLYKFSLKATLKLVGKSGGGTSPRGRKEMYLVKPESRYIWGANCTSNLASCVATAAAVYGIRNVRLNELRPIAQGRNITIGYFNTLDHLENPRELLEQSVEIAGNVIVETHGHRGGGGRQHLLYIHETLPVWAARKGWKLVDLTSAMASQFPGYKNFLYVISRNGGLA